MFRRKDVEVTGGKRAVAVHEGEQKVLAGADSDHARPCRRTACAGERFCFCAIYLHALLAVDADESDKYS